MSCGLNLAESALAKCLTQDISADGLGVRGV